jgi:hypothetical protein
MGWVLGFSVRFHSASSGLCFSFFALYRLAHMASKGLGLFREQRRDDGAWPSRRLNDGHDGEHDDEHDD